MMKKSMMAAMLAAGALSAQALDWIESDGDVWIDTGVRASSRVNLAFEGTVLDSAGFSCLVGADDKRHPQALGLWANYAGQLALVRGGEWIPIILAAQEPSGYIHSLTTVTGRRHFADANLHEFYTMGYFIELGVAHMRLTNGKDRRLFDAARRCADLFNNVVDNKLYLTGGVGVNTDEAMGANYELPHGGYCETCAGCGLAFWCLERTRSCAADERAHAVYERVLYNNILGSLSADGLHFFYRNPLTSVLVRDGWHGSPCCVGNLARTLLALKDNLLAVSADGKTLYVNNYMDEWELPLPEQEVTAIPEVKSCRGEVARQRGPIVYSWEGDGFRKPVPNCQRLNAGGESRVWKKTMGEER